MLRCEYHVAQQLVWDADFRRAFLSSPQQTVQERYPDLKELGRFGPQQFCGIEEAAYYRVASASRASKAVFPRGHQLVIAYGGLRFFEVLLADYLDAPRPWDAVYEVFDGYILGPHMLTVARKYPWSDGATWIVPVLEYEWARWHTRRVIEGWSSIMPKRGRLTEGACLVAADFDLLALLAEIDRLVSAWVPPEVYVWRARPGSGIYRAGIFAKNKDIAEVRLSEDTFDTVRAVADDPTTPIDPQIQEALIEIGLLAP